MWCSVSVLESVFLLAAAVHGHGFCPRIAAGVARGSTVRGPGRPGRFRVALPSGDVQGVQHGTGGGVRRGGERLQ